MPPILRLSRLAATLLVAASAARCGWTAGTVRVAAGMRFVGSLPSRAFLGPVRGQLVFTNYRDLVKVDAAPPPR
jgi:hypothetical protein